MERFDCLSRNCSLLGPHLLEASAGTGKTFAVEQIFVRLLIETDTEVDQILAVTFTKAATRELKERIRSNIEKAIFQLSVGEIEWDYLVPFQEDRRAIERLNNALRGFDQSQIFTIHGFCHRMLREFAFEAKLRFSSADPDQTSSQIPERLKSGVVDFLLHLNGDLLSSEQLECLLKKYKSVERLSESLLKVSTKEAQEAPTFAELYEQYKKLMEPWGLDRDRLLNDFNLVAKNYKVQIKGQFERQIRSLASSPSQEAFRFLLSEKGSIFEYLSPSNRRVKYTPISIESAPFFEWGEAHLLPFLKAASNSKLLFKTL